MAQRGGAAVGRGDGFLAVATEGGEHVGDELRAVVREDAESVAGLVDETGAGEIEFDVMDLFRRAVAIEIARPEKKGGEGIFPGISRFRSCGRALCPDSGAGMSGLEAPPTVSEFTESAVRAAPSHEANFSS